MSGDEDARPPRELTPAFYGCYDWHSSVHGTGCSRGSRACSRPRRSLPTRAGRSAAA